MELMGQKLPGGRVAALVADGFEMVELAVPLAALRLAGATVEVVSYARQTRLMRSNG